MHVCMYMGPGTGKPKITWVLRSSCDLAWTQKSLYPLAEALLLQPRASASEKPMTTQWSMHP